MQTYKCERAGFIPYGGILAHKQKEQ
jgi:hypothetical protein